MFIVYTADNCSFCDSAKQLLKERHQTFEEVDVLSNPEVREKFMEWGVRTVPQIEHNNVYIGGFDALKEYLEADHEG